MYVRVCVNVVNEVHKEVIGLAILIRRSVWWRSIAIYCRRGESEVSVRCLGKQTVVALL